MAIPLLVAVSYGVIAFTVVFLLLFAIRHYLLGYSRLRISRPKDSMELVGFHMPRVTVLIPMHNEERVAGDILQALVDSDYDWEKLEVIPINDRSDDKTQAIIDSFAKRYPFIQPLHRTGGQSGKPAALVEACARATGEILVLFDADYVPGRAVIKMLVAPFADPEIGASMGRVVPHNIGDSLLSGLLSLERSAGYQGVQQSRFNLGFTAQFGGTVGAVRASALESVGGWNPQSLTEDTDLTFALLLNGWKTAYVNRAECYEEVPRSWLVRRRQLSRWVTGHTECLHNYWPDLMRSQFLTAWEKVDALFLLAMYWTAPVLVLGWIASLLLFFTPEAHQTPWLPVALAFLGYQLFANQATFLEIGVASMLDGTRIRSLLLPLNLLNFFANTGAICNALRKFYWNRFWGSGGDGWYKTHRTRGSSGSGGFQGAAAGSPVATRSARGLYHARTQGD
ncbi:MAG: glycosyltransferase family 2 protein [Bryobacterales bacterium]|nr:glycosyltransferase family 2 protein [Bryobacterales bacterium]